MLRANAHQPPSPDLSQEAQAALRQFSLERLMAYGVDYSDAIELRARVSSGEDWREAAAGLAETCLSPPQHDVAMPSVRTQARRLLRASALLRMSQMMMIEDGPERAAIFADAARLYTEASALLGTPERLVVPTPNGPLVGCPMPHSTTYQMVIWLRPDETPTLDAGSVAALFRDRTGRDDLRLREVRWLSLSRPHLRLVDRFRVGRVFLAGDAAHVHPFWGAQGLNTSIQDAFNLGWKLALVLQGAPEPLLDTYEAERRPVAEAMLKVVSDLSAMPAEKQVRGRRTRQLDVGYRQSPLSRGGDGGRPDAKVKAGDRVPDARFGSAGEDRRRLFEAFQGPHFTLLLFGDAPAPRRAPRWPTSIVRVDRIPSGAGESYGIEGDAAVLVRPDNYVAFVAADPGSEALENWFDALRDVGEGAAPSAGPQAAHAEAGR